MGGCITESIRPDVERSWLLSCIHPYAVTLDACVCWYMNVFVLLSAHNMFVFAQDFLCLWGRRILAEHQPRSAVGLPMQREGLCIDIRVGLPWQRGQPLTMGEGAMPSFWAKWAFEADSGSFHPCGCHLIKVSLWGSDVWDHESLDLTWECRDRLTIIWSACEWWWWIFCILSKSRQLLFSHSAYDPVQRSAGSHGHASDLNIT